MKLGTLSVAELGSRLRGEGIRLRLGGLTLRITADVPPLVSQLHAMYGEHSLLDGPAIDDCWVAVRYSSALRRVISPNVEGLLDGRLAVLPVAARAALVMLETCLNWAILSSGPHCLLLHAGAVERDGRTVILPATSGSGKSTLCAGLVARGWRLVSEEVVIIDPADGRILPVPRPISLKNDSIPIGRALFGPDAVTEVFHGMPKGDLAYVRPPAASVAAAATPAWPALILSPRFGAGQPFTATRLSRAEAFGLVLDNSVNYGAMLRPGFEMVRRLVETCPTYAIRHGGIDPVAEFLDRLHAESPAGLAA